MKNKIMQFNQRTNILNNFLFLKLQ